MNWNKQKGGDIRKMELFNLQAIGDNPSSVMMIIGALFVVMGWSSSAIGVDGSFMIGLGIICIFLGVLLNIYWNNRR
jgi:hypothetical protein